MVYVLYFRKIKKGLVKYVVFFLLIGLLFLVFVVEYVVNFKGIDINEFINIVGKNLNKMVIIDFSVCGKVNVCSYELMDEKFYY